jgi:hypothetical protein
MHTLAQDSYSGLGMLLTLLILHWRVAIVGVTAAVRVTPLAPPLLRLRRNRRNGVLYHMSTFLVLRAELLRVALTFPSEAMGRNRRSYDAGLFFRSGSGGMEETVDARFAVLYSEWLSVSTSCFGSGFLWSHGSFLRTTRGALMLVERSDIDDECDHTR